jgi:hypothetical protein
VSLGYRNHETEARLGANPACWSEAGVKQEKGGDARLPAGVFMEIIKQSYFVVTGYNIAPKVLTLSINI